MVSARLMMIKLCVPKSIARIAACSHRMREKEWIHKAKQKQDRIVNAQRPKEFLSLFFRCSATCTHSCLCFLAADRLQLFSRISLGNIHLWPKLYIVDNCLRWGKRNEEQQQQRQKKRANEEVSYESLSSALIHENEKVYSSVGSRPDLWVVFTVPTHSYTLHTAQRQQRNFSQQ